MKPKTGRMVNSMHNIWKIFTTDIRRISNNVVAVVIIMGLSILPALYAWFNIFSNWDPYEPAATSQLKVAVASDDAGAEIMGLSLNVGDSVQYGFFSDNSGRIVVPIFNFSLLSTNIPFPPKAVSERCKN